MMGREREREREREWYGRGIAYAPIHAEEPHRLRWNILMECNEQMVIKGRWRIVVCWYEAHAYRVAGIAAV